MNASLETSQMNGAMTALTLRLQDEVFAIEAESVREILEYRMRGRSSAG
jgi:purine-binding chemotaxis protein CheW